MALEKQGQEDMIAWCAYWLHNDLQIPELKLERLFSCSISLTSLNISISSPSFLDLTNPGVASTGGLGSVATSWLPASPPAAQTFCTTKIYGQGWVLVDS